MRNRHPLRVFARHSKRSFPASKSLFFALPPYKVFGNTFLGAFSHGCGLPFDRTHSLRFVCLLPSSSLILALASFNRLAPFGRMHPGSFEGSPYEIHLPPPLKSRSSSNASYQNLPFLYSRTTLFFPPSLTWSSLQVSPPYLVSHKVRNLLQLFNKLARSALLFLHNHSRVSFFSHLF